MHSTSSDESTISLGDLTSDPFSSLGSSATFIISSIDISSTGFSCSRLWVRGAGCGFLAISFSISSTDIDSSGFSLKKNTMQRCRGESKRFLFITSVEQDLSKKPIGHSLVASSPCFKARLSAKILIRNFAQPRFESECFRKLRKWPTRRLTVLGKQGSKKSPSGHLAKVEGVPTVRSSNRLFTVHHFFVRF